MIDRFKHLLQGEKKIFNRFCRSYNLDLNFEINRNEYVVLRSIFENREYSDYFPFYKKVTILDIGAHFGYFSIFAQKNTDPNSLLIAIEPNKSNFSYLLKNIDNSKINNVKCLNNAIDGKRGLSKLFLGRTLNHSIIENYPLNQEQAPGSEIIETKTLEDIIIESKLEKLDFLKLDCEGAEYSILENTPRHIFDKITTISMEFHDLRNEKFTGEFLIQTLIMNGFKIVKYNYERTSQNLNYGKIIGTKILGAQ
jgi:FkbM family methyltransferase